MSKTPNNLTLDEICKHIKTMKSQKKKGLQYQQKPQTSNAKLAFHAKRPWTCNASTPTFNCSRNNSWNRIYLQNQPRSWDLPNTGYFHLENWHWNLTDLNINPFGSSLIHEIDVVVMLRVFLHQPIWSFWFQKIDLSSDKIWSYPFRKMWHCGVTALSIDKMWSFPFQRIWPCNWHGSTNRHVITLEMQLDWRWKLKRGRR